MIMIIIKTNINRRGLEKTITTIFNKVTYRNYSSVQK